MVYTEIDSNKKVVHLIQPLEEKKFIQTDTKDFAWRAAKALADVKGKDIVLLDFQGKSSYTDYFVIATGDSSTHLQALANRVREEMAKNGIRIDHTEGHDSSNWVLLDYHSVIVHIFSRKARDYYAIDSLWGDVEVIPWMEDN